MQIAVHRSNAATAAILCCLITSVTSITLSLLNRGTLSAHAVKWQRQWDLVRSDLQELRQRRMEDSKRR